MLPLPLSIATLTPAYPLPPPKLAVIVVVDQMRGDELEMLRDRWRAGLRTMIEEGQVCTHAQHTHGNTETASGHATVATGLLPA